MTPSIITVRWNAERHIYTVDRPNWSGGEVVAWWQVKDILARQAADLEHITDGRDKWYERAKAAETELDAQAQEIARLTAELAQTQRDRQAEHDLRVTMQGEAETLRARAEAAEKNAGKLVTAIERGSYCLVQMMDVYERRVRSDCTTEQLEKRPWECAEYIAASVYLRTMFPQADTARGGA